MTKEQKTHLLSVIEGIAAPIDVVSGFSKMQPPHIIAICHVLKNIVEAIPPSHS